VKAYPYARFSTDRQSETSADDQLRVCRDYAGAQGWRVAGEYRDQGISGAAIGNRPALLQLLEQLAAGDVVLVTDLSRLSRSQDLAPMLTRLRHRGIRVIGVQDGFDSDSPQARMQAGLSGIMSEEYRAMIAARVHSALDMRARAGRATGGKAYDNPEIVREIFARVAAGETTRSVCNDLNARGIPSPGASWKARSGPRGYWALPTLHELLKNERYVGRVIWNRSRWVKDPDTGKRIRRERPRSEWIETACPPVVDPETFQRVQDRMAARRHQVRPGRQPRYLLSGLLECGLCGSKLIIVGGSQRRYVCSAHHSGGPHACRNAASIPRAVTEARILEPVLEQLLSPAAIAEGVRMLREARAEAQPAPPPADRELAELERLQRDGLVSADILAPAIAEARRRAQERRRAVAQADMPWPTEKAWREAVAGIREVLQGDDVTAAREALRGLLGTIRCTPKGDHVVAEIPTAPVLLATGTGASVYSGGSGGALFLQIPRSTRGPV
jgi:DNA invertase Pin-like site-specific DNA recombinase